MLFAAARKSQLAANQMSIAPVEKVGLRTTVRSQTTTPTRKALHMKTRTLIVAFCAAAMLVPAGTASADHNVGPCNDSGEPGNSDYARHHIVVATPGHVPGAHGGFSVCLGEGKLVNKP